MNAKPMQDANRGPAPGDGVTVITLTRGDTRFLARCSASVRDQDFAGEIEHIIIGDDIMPDPTSFAEWYRTDSVDTKRRIRVHRAERYPTDYSFNPQRAADIYPRLGRMWNWGVRNANNPWVCFLDDDNEFDNRHISSLFALARLRQAEAVHSSRLIFNRDGSPYLDEIFPWCQDEEQGKRIFADLRSRGAWPAGGNVLHDKADPIGPGAEVRNSTIMSTTDPLVMVDMSAWLLRRDLLLRIPVPETITPQDVVLNNAPDGLLLEALLRDGVAIHSTGLPTLRYYLGGISNKDRL
ncbi:glycosyltransferase [Sphaerimonospora mesophila]|uniref:glycosyltransferase n=1 Tax=Sphaerimonospora mesophila TaxID=37483 RepID=UPI000AAF87AC